MKWHWATPTLAMLMLFVTLALWWRSYLWFSDVTSGTIADFLPKFLGMAVCFLMMAAALPDEVPESGIDLKEFYLTSRVHLWSLMSVTLGFSILIYFVDHRSIGVAGLLAIWWPTMISFALAIIAVATTRPWFHAIAIGWISAVALINNLFTPIGQ